MNTRMLFNMQTWAIFSPIITATFVILWQGSFNDNPSFHITTTMWNKSCNHIEVAVIGS